MAYSRNFDSTSPGALAAAQKVAPNPRSGDRNDLPLVAQIGAALSDPLRVMQSLLDELALGRAATPAHISHVKNALSVARTIATQSQQIARLGSGRLRQSHEKLKLDDLLREALQERTALFRQSGVELYQALKPVEVIVDAGLLVCLVDAALEWAVSMGRKLTVSLEMKNWPEHGMLLIRTSEGVQLGTQGDADADGDGNTLAWYLLVETASVMGVSVNRVVASSESSLVIEFPRTVKRLEGLTAVEVDTSYGQLGGDSKHMAGHRILVITDDSRLRLEIESTAYAMGLVVDFVLDSRQGVRFCELDIPHIVIIDERVRDPVFEELSADLRRADPNYPFIEIASESNVLEMAGWMSDSISRISRDSLRTQLSAILTMELAKVS